MKLSEIWERALFLLSVPKCICCGELLDFEEKALCSSCSEIFNEQKSRNCSRCSRKIPYCTCSNFYLESHYVKKLIKVYRYNSSKPELPGNLLVYCLKHDNRRDAFIRASVELAHSIEAAIDLSENKENFIITNVPRRHKAILENGYDHAEMIARRIAKILGIEYAQFLVSKTEKPQKEVYGEKRKENAKFDYKKGPERSLKGKTVIIVDDVVTTGSSLAACAALIRGMGTRKIIGAALSIAYKDSYLKPRPSYSR